VTDFGDKKSPFRARAIGDLALCVREQAEFERILHVTTHEKELSVGQDMIGLDLMTARIVLNQGARVGPKDFRQLGEIEKRISGM
jgi:hypothetical protein